jgi:ATP-dependent Zn protease
MPGADEREKIWSVQIHPSRTPLAKDVDFRALAEKYAISGGDIKNAVLKAAAAAAAEPVPDRDKRIHQSHLERAVGDVIAAKEVMRQSLFEESVAAGFRRPARVEDRRSTVVAIYLAAAALIVALTALTIVLLR